jgi:hypothetical protein
LPKELHYLKDILSDRHPKSQIKLEVVPLPSHLSEGYSRNYAMEIDEIEDFSGVFLDVLGRNGFSPAVLSCKDNKKYITAEHVLKQVYGEGAKLTNIFYLDENGRDSKFADMKLIHYGWRGFF